MRRPASTKQSILQLAASVERASEHPLAAAIVAAAEQRKIALSPATDFDSPTGKGALGTVEGKRVALGNAPSSRSKASIPDQLAAEAEKLRADGATAIFVGIDGKVAGVIAIADPVKASTQAALEALRADGIRIVMLTGDNRTTAAAIARRLGITEIEAEVLPDQKSAVVDQAAARGPRRRHGR